MTVLSVNLNKIAWLRNSRGRDYPNVVDFAGKFYHLGVRGITVHPRQDERHITRRDARDLGDFTRRFDDCEYNIEGYPSEEFLALVEDIGPTQCTLVPDAPDQLTSDHGWDLTTQGDLVRTTCARLQRAGIRTSIFLDPSPQQVRLVPETGSDRIELYTEDYAASYLTTEADAALDKYRQAAALARQLGIGVNAGHDLDLTNLARFLEIDGILEVSIGHALTVECIEQGMATVVAGYLAICSRRNGADAVVR